MEEAISMKGERAWFQRLNSSGKISTTLPIPQRDKVHRPARRNLGSLGERD
jgi:hypothetical protein